MMEIDLVVNGAHQRADVSPGETLLELLRRLGYTSVKDGCANGDCGSCAVLLGGRAVTSCLVFAAKADGVAITTIEGMTAAEGVLHPLQRALLDTGGVQCGFCIPAMALTALDLLAHHAHPSRKEIESYLVGNLCRCTGYVKQLEAIERTVDWMREAGI
jgi:aerobic-type carbon monoxide dehydrogenase small subunit (CoxS/CutS family)